MQKVFFGNNLCSNWSSYNVHIQRNIFYRVEFSEQEKRILCFLGLLRGENPFFCGLKSAPWVIKTPGARVFALVLRHMRNQHLYMKYNF